MKLKINDVVDRCLSNQNVGHSENGGVEATNNMLRTTQSNTRLMRQIHSKTNRIEIHYKKEILVAALALLADVPADATKDPSLSSDEQTHFSDNIQTTILSSIRDGL